jgi:hypothetical protein
MLAANFGRRRLRQFSSRKLCFTVFEGVATDQVAALFAFWPLIPAKPGRWHFPAWYKAKPLAAFKFQVDFP